MMHSFQMLKDLEVERFIYKTSIHGLLYIDRTLHGDDRGFFSEVTHIPAIQRVTGIDFSIKQINHARSETNVVRGIHAEDWNKFVFLASGRAFCAVVDLRKDSPTYKQVESFILGYGDQDLHGGLFIPRGLGNSVATLSGPLEYIYFVDKLYTERDPAGDTAISLFDPQLNIEWPIPREQMVLSQRDKNAVLLG